MPLFAVSLALAFVGSSSIAWQPGLPQATEIAAQSHKLIMVDFYTDWCVWCKKLDADTYTAPDIVARSRSFVPVRVNAAKEGVETAKKYRVSSYPTILFLSADGRKVWQVRAYMPPADFADQMDLAQTVDQRLPMLEAALADHPNDGYIAAQLVVYYTGVGATDKLAKLAPVVDANAPHDTLVSEYGFNGLGDYYQRAKKFDRAVAEFNKVIDSKFPEQTAYARFCMAQCYESMGQHQKTIQVLQDYLKMGHAADPYRSGAQQMLDRLQGQPQFGDVPSH